MYRNAFLLSFVAGLVCPSNIHAAPQPGRVVEVIDGDTLKVVSLDGNGKESDKTATFGIRGVAAPPLDQPFGKQALARLKEMVEGKKVIWNGPVLRANKEGRSLHFRTENGKSLALQMLSEGLGRVVVSELEDKSAKPADPKKFSPEVTAAMAAEREAREAKRGLWAGNEATVNKTDHSVRPKGLRVLFDGNSWFNFVPGIVAEMAKASGINGHKEVKPAKPNDFQDQLGEVDVYAHGIHWWWHDEWLKRVEQSAETGLKANPDFRAYCHAAWVVHDIRIDDAKIKTVDDYNNADLDKVQAEIDKYRQLVEAAVDKMNGKFGKRVVFVVPVGDATVKLRRMVVAGKFPGVTKQSELWSDVMPHPGRQVRALSGYCHFAAIYRTSPVGLQNNNFYLRADDPLPITAEQHAILQKIAWDVVSQYPYAGIAAPANPGARASASSGKKDEPETPTSGPVPKQLKGWKATSEMPGAGVVADYNDYIEKLPKDERTGVANVKYYVDSNGLSAVAVLVNVDRVEWAHLLTYDKQNKRAGVTKFVVTK